MLLFAALLFAAQMTTSTQAANGPATSCCQKITTTVERTSVDWIVSYQHQEMGLCPITAVRFTTIRGITLCSDPESSRAKFVMCVVDQEKITSRKRAKEICRGVSTTSLPVTSTDTPSTMITTLRLPTDSPATSPPTQESPITKEPPTTIKTLQRTPTPGTSTESTALMSPTAPVENERSTSATTPRPKFPETTTWPGRKSTEKSRTTAKTVIQTAVDTDKSRTTVKPGIQTAVDTDKSRTTVKPGIQTAVDTDKSRPTVKPGIQTAVVTEKSTTTAKTVIRPATDPEKYITTAKPGIQTAVVPEKSTRSAKPGIQTAVVPEKSTRSAKPEIQTAVVPEKSTRSAKPKETPKVARLPWTVRRLRKKSKSGLRRAQRKPRG